MGNRVALPALACTAAFAAATAFADSREPEASASAENAAAEARLAELLAEIRSGTHAPADKRHPVSPLDFGFLSDCADVDPRELDAAASASPNAFTSRDLYNGTYTWAMVPRGGTARCVYLAKPLDRGLDASDAADFLMAEHLKLGWLESFRVAHHFPREKIEPDLDRTIALAVGRFGVAAESSERMPPDLADCEALDTQQLPAQITAGIGGFGEWMFDGNYSWEYYHFPSGTCVVLGVGQDSRGLTASEARAWLRAARAGVEDKDHADAQRAWNCHYRVLQTFGGNVPAYESGVVADRRYRVFYAALDADMKPLDLAQHAWASELKAQWAHDPPPRQAGEDVDIEVHVQPSGRTRALATLEAYAAPGRFGDWLLYVPSGTLVRFEDLFSDSDAVHELIVATFIAGAPHWIYHVLSSTAFLGDDADQQAAAYRERYLAAAQRVAASGERFRRIGFGYTEDSKLLVHGVISPEILPDGSPSSWSVPASELAPYLKPQFRDVFDFERCPPLPSPEP